MAWAIIPAILGHSGALLGVEMLDLVSICVYLQFCTPKFGRHLDRGGAVEFARARPVPPSGSERLGALRLVPPCTASPENNIVHGGRRWLCGVSEPRRRAAGWRKRVRAVALGTVNK